MSICFLEHSKVVLGSRQVTSHCGVGTLASAAIIRPKMSKDQIDREFGRSMLYPMLSLR